MAITVTKKFRDDFEAWSAHRVASGEWEVTEMAQLKDVLRRDLAPGLDQLRLGVQAITATGVEVPAAIDDHEERYRLWAEYFSVEAEAIRQLASTAR